MSPAPALEQYRKFHRLLAAGNVAAATRACDALVAVYPGFPPAWASASQLALMQRNFAGAIACAERAVALEPDNPRYLTVKAQALWAGAAPEAALAAAANAATRCGSDPLAWQELGTFYVSAERFPDACDACQRAVALAPASADARFNLAAVLRILGRLDEAESEYDRVIALKPSEHEAYANRTELRRQTPERNHVAELERLLAAGIGHPRGEVFIRHALAKELEDLGRYADSFRQLQQGASLRRRHIEYDMTRDIETFAWIATAFPTARLRHAVANAPDAAPIFIVGMPRTGTTLVERVLGQHSQVFAAGELSHFADAIVAAARAATGKVALPRDELIKASSELDFAALGADYLSRARKTTGAHNRFVDKMPLNFLYCGLIHLALPNARIVHLTRHPLATCYAVYKTLFKDAYPFSYDLKEIAAYYAGYRRLMQHWHTVMPGVICDVNYETLVRNLESETRRLLTFCQLEWEPACLEFHRNPTPSTTASASQVRRPLYNSSIDLWRHYASELQPLRAALEAEGVTVDANPYTA